MSNLETNGSPQLELVRSYIQAIEKKDINQAEKTLHKDYRRITHPSSAGRPVQTREEYLQHNKKLAALLIGDCEVIHVGGCPIFFTPG